jgi:multiphosphoryl transfer protein
MTSTGAQDGAVLSLLAPLSGVLVPLDRVPDAAFAQRLAGDGISIDPLDDNLVAPCDARVLQVHRAGHALTLEASGLELVVHIGLDTVEPGARGSLRS